MKLSEEGRVWLRPVYRLGIESAGRYKRRKVIVRLRPAYSLGVGSAEEGGVGSCPHRPGNI
jgi:hypothetical protein